MKIQKKQKSEVKRTFNKPSLIDHDAIEKYIDLFGTPVCACCGFITLLPIFRRKDVLWAVYCLNCGITRDVIGICMHEPGEDMSKRMINSEKMFKKLLDK